MSEQQKKDIHLITKKARLQYILKCLNAFQLFL